MQGRDVHPGEHEHTAEPAPGLPVYSWCGLQSDAAAASDFPLTGNCFCGRFIVREKPAQAWRHRAPDEAPITEPASDGWLTVESLLPPITLSYLRHHWGDAYVVSHDGRGRWSARRMDGKGTVTADSAEALRDAIRADYLAERVPRLTCAACGMEAVRAPFLPQVPETAETTGHAAGE